MIKNKLGNIFSITILICIILILVVNFPKGKQYVFVNTLSDNIGDISNLSEIKQTFYANDNKFYGIGIIFGKYMSEYNYDIEIIISDKENNIIARKELNGRDIREGKFTYIYFDEIKDSLGEEYSIYINSLNKSTNEEITIYSSNYNDYIEGDLYIDGIKQDFDISFMTEYKKSIKESIIEIVSLINSSISYLLIILAMLFISLFNLTKSIFNKFYFGGDR